MTTWTVILILAFFIKVEAILKIACSRSQEGLRAMRCAISPLLSQPFNFSVPSSRRDSKVPGPGWTD
ncbi:hypothetical protein PENANT_c003G10742 [Penicillium antarcticum]|uniref:Secreted protein n=1 Tax=Penicillium antarcticum TaxID=416450 RepID=A0A1V6QIN9_9EURO|nr:hypothetical protein PENANT_c003G10742 [Penicillium antarcticum]